MANINRFNTPSRSTCIECDEPIPPKRQALGGVKHCIDCQNALERRR
ncbi:MULTISPECIES: TraR/DksA C4-type zinc finger protein [unclassified Psychrobacter]|nr:MULTISPECIES: TraR/DksA C4-type zinc finger protein [unclassified Psychrobacter]